MKENTNFLNSTRISKQIQKTLFFRFVNKFTKQEIFTLEVPYLPFLATIGEYSQLYKRMKSCAAIGFETSLVRCKKWFEAKKTDRATISYPNGLSLDFPYDITEDDMKIIVAQLEVLKMSCKK